MAWKLFCHVEALAEFRALDPKARLTIETRLIDLKDKEDWRDNRVEGYDDLARRDTDDCFGLGRIQVRIPRPPLPRKLDRVIEIIGELSHEVAEFRILGFRDRGSFLKPDRGFYREFCEDARVRLEDREDVNYAEVF